MKFHIPAKTFLVGEYIALTGGPAIVLTTTPCFSAEWNFAPHLSFFFHPDSPAGQLWAASGLSQELEGLSWFDPYDGIGGMGASSAEFLAVYGAIAQKRSMPIHLDDLLKSYQMSSWSGVGLPPSGYDVLAQCFEQCVFLYERQQMRETKPWPFRDLSFILVHTQHKLSTHAYLKKVKQNEEDQVLSTMALKAFQAFNTVDAELLITAIQGYYQQLSEKNLVAEHTCYLLENISKWMHPLAAKGCGAMGSDVLFFLVPTLDLESLVAELKNQNYLVLSTSKNLYTLADYR